MSNYSIVSTTIGGSQLTASGYTNIQQVREHVQERVRLARYGGPSSSYANFVVVASDAEGVSVSRYSGEGEYETELVTAAVQRDY